MSPKPFRSPAILDASTASIGDVRESSQLLTSRIEEEVRTAVIDAGHRVARVRVVCRNPNHASLRLLLTPDIALVDHKIAVEVDPCGQPGPSSRGSTHRGQEEKDRARNDLLGEAGWTVIRVRFSATEGMHVGPRDVVVESAGLTRTALTELLAAVEDAIEGRPARVRQVRKGRSPGPAQRRQHVVNIGAWRNSDDGHIFNWYPSLKNPEKHTLRLSMAGRFLYTHCGMRFIAEVGLHEVPEEEWRQRLTEYLSDADPAGLGTSRWPWGEHLFGYRQGDSAAVTVVQRGESKIDIDTLSWRFTANHDGVRGCDGTALTSEDGAELVWLHAAAVDLGYRITHLALRTGRHGPYQEIVVSRASTPSDGCQPTRSPLGEG